MEGGQERQKEVAQAEGVEPGWEGHVGMVVVPGVEQLAVAVEVAAVVAAAAGAAAVGAAAARPVPGDPEDAVVRVSVGASPPLPGGSQECWRLGSLENKTTILLGFYICFWISELICSFKCYLPVLERMKGWLMLWLT